jgi:hypothetical protein
MRLALLLLAFAAALPAPEPAAPPPEFVQAVEFPYYLYPPSLWGRELVWLKNVGIRTVEFSIPWNWHQAAGGAYDFTGATSPRRDLLGFIRLLRRLEMRRRTASQRGPGCTSWRACWRPRPKSMAVRSPLWKAFPASTQAFWMRPRRRCR